MSKPMSYCSELSGVIKMEKEFIKLISSVVKMIKKGEKYNYNMYIQKVYDETKDIVNNYFKILNDTKHFLEDRQKTLDEIIIFLENKRVDFRTIRCEVRTIVSMDNFI